MFTQNLDSLTYQGTWELVSLNSMLLHFKHFTRWFLQTTLYSLLTSFKEIAELNRYFSCIYKVIIMDLEYYMCYALVVILKQLKKYKAIYFYHKWSQVGILLSFYIYFTLYYLDSLTPFPKLYHWYFMKSYYVKRIEVKDKDEERDNFIIMRELELS